MQLGFLQRTPRGRSATIHAYRHLGIAHPEEETNKQQGDQQQLF